ncbi:MAG: EF-hand domain-containing protein [Verrucomicrobiota bacterium]
MSGAFWLLLGLACGWAQSDESCSAGLDVETIQEFGSLDRNRNSGLDRLEFAFAEVSQRAREHGGRDQVDRVFERMDKDESGEIELLELAASQLNRNVRILDRHSARGYEEMDHDGDGLVAVQEYLDSPKAKQALDSGQEPGFVASLFKRIDLNSSTVVGPFEWIQALGPEKQLMDADSAAVFAAIDRNDDGSIDVAEHKAIDPGELMVDVSVFTTIDLNGNREVGPREFARATTMVAGPDVNPEMMDRFKDLDRNRDGALSRREYSKSRMVEKFARSREMEDAMFSKADHNRDDEIDLQEFADSVSGRRKFDFGPPGKGPPGKGKGKGR